MDVHRGLQRDHVLTMRSKEVLMQNFRVVLSFCDLKDLGFEGDVFTWCNNNFQVEGYIREKARYCCC